MNKRAAATARRSFLPAKTADKPDVFALTCTGATVRRLSRRMTSFYEHRMQRTGLKLSQYSVLASLSEQPQSLLQLSHRLETDRTTLTRNLKPLLASGWVAEAAGDDARRRLLVLTPAGRQLRHEARDAWKAAQLALEKQLGAELVAKLHTHLDDALSKLKAVLPEEN